MLERDLKLAKRMGFKNMRLPIGTPIGVIEKCLPLAEKYGQLRAGPAAARHAAGAARGGVGRPGVAVRLLLEAGEDPNRYNPDGYHSHSTPLHQAALAGHLLVMRLLVEAGARLDINDKYWNGTALEWARYGGRAETAEYLRRRRRPGDLS